MNERETAVVSPRVSGRLVQARVEGLCTRARISTEYFYSVHVNDADSPGKSARALLSHSRSSNLTPQGWEGGNIKSTNPLAE